MSIACALGRHVVVDRGVSNREHQFGRCGRCSCDLVRVGSAWKRVPKGFKVVWRPRTGSAEADVSAGQAAIGREVDLKGVTVVGERAYGAQRFALVILNAKDDRSYAGSTDRLDAPGAIAAQMENRLHRFAPASVEPKQESKRVSEMVQIRDEFDWERNIPSRTEVRLIE